MTPTLRSTLDVLGYQPTSAADLHERFRFQCSHSTLSRQLAALYREGAVDREWEGNRRYGHYVYVLKD
jgi:DNA-binding transcriptional ArsR family regulator